MDLFIPTWLDLAGWAGVIAVAASLIGLGRLLTAGTARPEAALLAGWGGAVLVLTLWGVLTPESLRYPGTAIIAAGAAGLCVPGVRLSRGDWRGIVRIIVLALPLLAVLASARPSEPDTFLNLLPNAGYLYDHAAFPGAGRAAAHSYLPGAPYNLQLAAFLAGLLTPDFPANALIAFDVLLLLAAGLLLARVAAGETPSWGTAALGLLLATALNPGFVPRIHLAGYSDPAVMVALAFAGWHALQMLERLAAGRRALPSLLALALTLAALVEIKQDSVALAAALVATAALIGLASAARWRAVAACVVAALPAAALYLAWRWYVLTQMPGGELAPLPLALWQPEAIPLILRHMLETMAQKGVFYGVLLLTLAAGLWRLQRRGLTMATRAALLLGGSVLLHNGALLFAYVAHFRGTMGSDAHSYFRYGTQQSLLLMLALVLLLREEAAERSWRWSGPIRRIAPAALIVAMLACPLAFLRFLRFDLEVPALRLWQIARVAAPNLGGHDRVALLLPGDLGSVAPALETILRTVPPRHPDLDVTIVPEVALDTLDRLAAQKIRVAIISCAPPGFADVPHGTGALLRRDDAGWHTVEVWRYAPPPAGARWSHVLGAAPLCLG